VAELNIGHFLMGEALFVGLPGDRRDAPRDGCRTRLTTIHCRVLPSHCHWSQG
jgi:hypothetical protein